MPNHSYLSFNDNPNKKYSEIFKKIEGYRNTMHAHIITQFEVLRTKQAGIKYPDICQQINWLAFDPKQNKFISTNTFQPTTPLKQVVQDDSEFQKDLISRSKILKALNQGTAEDRFRFNLGVAYMKFQAAKKAVDALSIYVSPPVKRQLNFDPPPPAKNPAQTFNREISKLVPIIAQHRTQWCHELIEFLGRVAKFFLNKSKGEILGEQLQTEAAALLPATPTPGGLK